MRAQRSATVRGGQWRSPTHFNPPHAPPLAPHLLVGSLPQAVPTCCCLHAITCNGQGHLHQNTCKPKTCRYVPPLPAGGADSLGRAGTRRREVAGARATCRYGIGGHWLDHTYPQAAWRMAHGARNGRRCKGLHRHACVRRRDQPRPSNRPNARWTRSSAEPLHGPPTHRHLAGHPAGCRRGWRRALSTGGRVPGTGAAGGWLLCCGIWHVAHIAMAVRRPHMPAPSQQTSCQSRRPLGYQRPQSARCEPCAIEVGPIAVSDSKD